MGTFSEATGMLGKEVGNYRLTRLLGEGGMGAVYLGEHTTLTRRVAVKLLRPELGLRPQVTERFFNEARAANAIRHPNIIEVLDLGTIPNLRVPFLIMEYLDGESLARRLERTGRLSIAEAVSVAQQTAAAIGAAHAQGIVHRDLKPDNLFLVSDPALPGFPRVKVLDFGIAKLSSQIAPSAFRTQTGAMMGTPMYMSPEQCRGVQKDVGPRADIYALGCILYQMLCGQPPFVSEGPGAVLVMQISEPPVAPRIRNPAVPEHLELAVLRALAKNPEDRFASMDELGLAVDEKTWPSFPPAFLPTARVRPVLEPYPRAAETPSGRELPPRRRARLGWMGLTSGVLVAAGAVALTTWRWPAPFYATPAPPPSEAARATTPGPAPPMGGVDQAARRYLDAADQLRQQKRFDPALDMLNLAARLPIADPELNIRLTHLRDLVSTGALLEKAATHLDQQEWRLATAAAQQALRRDPRNTEALDLLDRARAAERSRPASGPTRERSRDRRARVGVAAKAAPPIAPLPAAAPPAVPVVSLPPPAADPPATASPASPGPPAAKAPGPASPAALAPAGAEGSQGTLEPSGLRSSPSGLRSSKPRDPIPVPRLPRVHTVADPAELARVCALVEAETVIAGVSAAYARGLTRPLQRQVRPGEDVHPVAMYYFIVKEAALGRDHATTAASLVTAHDSGAIRLLEHLPAVQR